MSPKWIGLTGNIGCGKSTIAKILAKDDRLQVIDTDKLWKSLMAKEDVAHTVASLLSLAVNQDSKLDPQKVADCVFQDASKRSALEAYACEAVVQEIQRITVKEVVVIESAILFEAGMDARCAEVLVATCSEQEQRRRVLARRIPGRSPLTEQEFVARKAAQWPQEKKALRATETIHTECWPEQLEARVLRWKERMLGRVS